MASTQELLAQAKSAASSNPKKAEEIYKQILSDKAGKPIDVLFLTNQADSFLASSSRETRDEQIIKEQETALVSLGELYRDQK
jgi:26S proteasome regulatory subunit N6